MICMAQPTATTELPDIPRHVHKVGSNGQITLPKELREQFESDEFVIWTDSENKMIHLYPTEEQ